jgi:hypothetical protein
MRKLGTKEGQEREKERERERKGTERGKGGSLHVSGSDPYILQVLYEGECIPPYVASLSY